MSFRLFIYYCAIGGGWAAFLAWGLLAVMGVATVQGKSMGQVVLVGAFLGCFVAAAIGLVDGILNSTGSERYLRSLISGGIGFVGGAIGSLLGAALFTAGEGGLIWLVIGWMVAGVLIGAASGLFDLLRAAVAQRGVGQSVRKSLNGVYGGLLGGLLGGFPFGLLTAPSEDGTQALPLSGLAIGLTILGICIGLMVALAQVFLKEAWILVESGRRAGRQLMLSKDETTIGRAEKCDLGLFGDNAIEKLHARILLKNNRYLLDDAETPGGTFLNNVRVSRPTPLKDGDAIRVGSCVLRFGERQKKH
jgi:hypothetical protein